ncbi:hypothetical protein [Paraburkholderia caffeinilytica]|uniref:hypothetical protein n=1 Tax=Paraburkholderia caffeinilytica TaxID=1761016 RepID=UPI003DA13E94
MTNLSVTVQTCRVSRTILKAQRSAAACPRSSRAIQQNDRTTTMKPFVLRMLTALAPLGVGFSSAVCNAYALDAQLDCQSSPHDFIAPLLNEQSIDPKPMRVEADSVNAFRPTRGSNLTAFGFRVYAVFGYEQDDPMFKKGSGRPVESSIYGVVVTGSTASVEARVRQAGSKAVIHEVMPLVLTAVFCNGQ